MSRIKSVRSLLMKKWHPEVVAAFQVQTLSPCPPPPPPPQPRPPPPPCPQDLRESRNAGLGDPTAFYNAVATIMANQLRSVVCPNSPNSPSPLLPLPVWRQTHIPLSYHAHTQCAQVQRSAEAYHAFFVPYKNSPGIRFE